MARTAKKVETPTFTEFTVVEKTEGHVIVAIPLAKDGDLTASGKYTVGWKSGHLRNLGDGILMSGLVMLPAVKAVPRKPSKAAIAKEKAALLARLAELDA